jgi:hypothetical protein
MAGYRELTYSRSKRKPMDDMYRSVGSALRICEDNWDEEIEKIDARKMKPAKYRRP